MAAQQHSTQCAACVMTLSRMLNKLKDCLVPCQSGLGVRQPMHWPASNYGQHAVLCLQMSKKRLPCCCTGGHNVIAGVLDYIHERHPGSTLVGFRGGPGGILAKDFMEITQDTMVSPSGAAMCYDSDHLARVLP